MCSSGLDGQISLEYNESGGAMFITKALSTGNCSASDYYACCSISIRPEMFIRPNSSPAIVFS